MKHLKEFRALRTRHFDLVMQLDAMTKEADELEIKDVVQLASSHVKALMDSKEYAAQKFTSLYLSAMKQKMLTAVADVNKWKRVVISQHDAQEHAMLEYMTKSEREALKDRIARDKVNTRYRVTVSDTLSNNTAASIIADAIFSDPKVVPLVARSSGNNLEMEKD